AAAEPLHRERKVGERVVPRQGLANYREGADVKARRLSAGVHPRHRIPRPPSPPQLTHQLPAGVIDRVAVLRDPPVSEVSRSPGVHATSEFAVRGREERPFEVTADVQLSPPRTSA